MRRNNVIAALLAATLALSLCACNQTQQVEEKPDFTQAREIAKLSTLTCSYHNVAEFYDDGTQIFGGLSIGYKKAWFEYDGTVTLGIDAAKVTIGEPDENGNVTITLPEAEIQNPQVNAETFSPIYSSTGLVTQLTTEDQTAALESAQSQMVESAQADETLLEQARSRAGILLKSYVENTGKTLGKTYTVSFVDEDGNDLRIVEGEVQKVSGQIQGAGTSEGEVQQGTESEEEKADSQQ